MDKEVHFAYTNRYLDKGYPVAGRFLVLVPVLVIEKKCVGEDEEEEDEEEEEEEEEEEKDDSSNDDNNEAF